MRLIVTRPLAQATAWVAQLRTLGVDAVALPLLAMWWPTILIVVGITLLMRK